MKFWHLLLPLLLVALISAGGWAWAEHELEKERVARAEDYHRAVGLILGLKYQLCEAQEDLKLCEGGKSAVFGLSNGQSASYGLRCGGPPPRNVSPDWSESDVVPLHYSQISCPWGCPK